MSDKLSDKSPRPTRKLAFLIIAALCVLLSIVLIRALLPSPTPTNDEARFVRWNKSIDSYSRSIWWDQHLPGSVGVLFKFTERENKNLEEHDSLGKALLASGYLTNFSIPVAAPPKTGPQWLQLIHRLENAFQGRKGWEFGATSNAIIMTCRPQDMNLCIHAIQD